MPLTQFSLNKLIFQKTILWIQGAWLTIFGYPGLVINISYGCKSFQSIVHFVAQALDKRTSLTGLSFTELSEDSGFTGRKRSQINHTAYFKGYVLQKPANAFLQHFKSSCPAVFKKFKKKERLGLSLYEKVYLSFIWRKDNFAE